MIGVGARATSQRSGRKNAGKSPTSSGDDVEVVAPPAVRAHPARLGRELVTLYEEADAPEGPR